MNTQKITNEEPEKDITYYLITALSIPLLILQLIVAVWFFNFYRLDFLLWGAVFFIISFLIFGWSPMYTLKVSGEAKEDTLSETTKLVKSGLYGYVRHPQFLSWIFFSISLTCLSQFWVVVILNIVIILTIYLDAVIQDDYLKQKFGKEYENYMKEVPRINPLMNLLK
ncbi:MAG: hypothetical protein GF317_11575 [Candidatus Lokiarchaeota archaeon]|nr:hypothetical protein [Candidatus Lokiarchaeota archaeon]MBD3200291.1 hypothetical protein [Candidatus Lokiarchaeota archaeon]